MSIEPTPSFPSLHSLLERLPDDDGADPYTNGALFEERFAEAAVDVTVIDRPTPTPVVMSPPPVAAPRRPWALLAAPLAFVIGVGATLAVDRSLDEQAATAHASGLATTVDDATSSLQLITDVAVVDGAGADDVLGPASSGSTIARSATAANPVATPIEPAATPVEPAATPIEPAADERTDARATLNAALVGEEAPAAQAFDREAARLAVNATASAAKACGDGSLTGDASVTVTFAHSGRATSALVNGSLAGTEVGSCIANVMRGATVPAYEGDLVSVRRLVRIR